MQKTLLFLAFATFSLAAQAQYSGPRLFWDIPSLYLTAPDASMIGSRTGVGAETAFNVAAHWGTTRIGGGSTFTIDPGARDIGDSFRAIPYLLLEGGGGLYRTNGNRCSQTKANAFTAMALIGLRYDMDTRPLRSAAEDVNYGLAWGIGAELGHFYIRDVFRNTEIAVKGMYYPQRDVVAVNLGFKVFLNVREMGRY